MSIEAIKKALEGVDRTLWDQSFDGVGVIVSINGQIGRDVHALKRNSDYVKAASPAAITELILDLETAQSFEAMYRTANAELHSEIDRLQRENEKLRSLADRFKLEAQGHAMEARTANSTIYEIYQIVTDAKGEPGNWRGAEPVRKYVSQLMIDASNHAADAETVRREREVERRRAEAAESEVKRLQTELALSKPLYSRRQIEARVKLLEAALKPFADLAECYDPDENDGDLKCWHDGSIPKIKDLRRARTALASTGGEHHAE